GINPEFVPYLFERFRQADSSTRRAHKGLGLGLSIVRHLVELHGGRVWADSEGEGRGAVFTVVLPVPDAQQSAAGEQPRWSRRAPASYAGCPSLDGMAVLVVDDEPDVRELLCAVLEQQGAETVAAGSAADAMAAIAERRFDVLVSDIGMPEQDGYD